MNRGAVKWTLEYLPDCTMQCIDIGCLEPAVFCFRAGGLGSYHCARLPERLVREAADRALERRIERRQDVRRLRPDLAPAADDDAPTTVSRGGKEREESHA